ncbi:hypothetical protein [Pseudomonas sp. UMAB-40]|uniref:hypothetical protein n=1 Tax=Pseudomonas sp. UMAB-40 TaxID=1365407 RepID=UPI00214BDFE9|nr:hypothetical protein [Pseudomonas sp. UMAB-40]
MADAGHRCTTKLLYGHPLTMSENDERLHFHRFIAVYLSDLTVADTRLLVFDDLAVEIQFKTYSQGPPFMSHQITSIDKVVIPLWTTPVIHPDNPEGGVGLILVTPAGLQVLIDPWFNMSEFDTAELVLNALPTGVSKTIQSGEENKRFTLNLPGGFLQNGINRISLRVKRVSQEPETSADLVFLFNTPRPGGEVTGTGDNPNLVMTLPADVIAKGVDAERAAQGVDVTLAYPYLRAHDEIILDCDGHTVRHTVTTAQAGAGRVVLKLFADAFQNDNPRFAMRFRVVDQIGNSSGPQAIWSSTTHIDVHVKRPVLDLKPPKVLEALGNNGTELTFDDMYSAEHARVQVSYTGSLTGHTVKVYWVGRNNTYGSEIQTIGQPGQTLTFLIDRLDVIDCIGSGAEVYYTVKYPGISEPLESRPLHLTVIAQRFHLPEPTLSSDKRTATVSYVGMTSGYSIRIAWHGKVTRYGPDVPITNTSQMRLAIDPAWIAESEGLPVRINYTILRTGSGDRLMFSWILRLQV